MASRSDVEAGKAHVLLYIKNKIASGLQSAGKDIMVFGAGVKAAGAAIVGPLIAAATHFAKTGSSLYDLSLRTGQSVESLSELKYAAEQSGASLQDIEVAIKKQQMEGLGSDFDRVAASIAAIEDPAKRTEAALAAWGKSGTKLLPMVKDLAALRQRARDLGLVVSTEDAEAADRLGDALDDAKAVMMDIVFEVGAALVPMLIPVLETIRGIAVGTAKWAQENRGVFQLILAIGAGLMVAGAAIIVLGAGTALLGTALGGIAAILSPTGLIVIGIGIIIGLIAAAAVAFFRFNETGQKIWGNFSDAARPFFEYVNASFKGITDSLMAGDLTRAWDIALKTMEVSWLQFELQVEKFGNMVIDSFRQAWRALVEDVLRGVNLISEMLGGDKFGVLWSNKTSPSVVAGRLVQSEIELLNMLAAAEGAKQKAFRPFAPRDFDLIDFDEGKKKEHPSQVASTTHEALALTFGGNAKDVVKRDEEKDLLRQIRALLANGDKATAAILQDILREMRRTGGARFGK